MNFFPTPYPDEILYSVLARYSIRSGNTSDIHVIEDLYSTRNIVASIELPCKIDALIENMPVNSQYTAESLINNHTLFPYHTAFASIKKTCEVVKAMRTGRGSRPYTMLGISSGFIKQNDYLRFCPECFCEDIKRYGEPFWHRLHQIVGVFICPKHQVMIQNSKVLIRAGNRQRYIRASEQNCVKETKDNKYVLSSDLFAKMLWMSKDIDYVLNHAYKPDLDRWYISLYNERLVHEGYARMNNYIKQKELRSNISNFYGDEYLELMQSSITGETSNWLSSLVRQNEYNIFTCRHLLLARFLDIKVKDLFNPSIDRYIDLQEVWDARLCELVSQKISIREIASIMRSCTKTIRKRIDALGIEHYWRDNGGGKYNKIPYVKTNEFKEKRKTYREQWIQLLKEYPDKSSNQLRNANQTIYRWLTTYDLEWLRERVRKTNCRRNLVDWGKRDKELLAKVKEVVKLMSQEGKPQRITWGTIGSKLGVSGWFSKNKDKLPHTKRYIDSVHESLEKYQIRKIIWAIKELEFHGTAITKWNIIETAGVKPKYLSNIAFEINDILKEKGYGLTL